MMRVRKINFNNIEGTKKKQECKTDAHDGIQTLDPLPNSSAPSPLGHVRFFRTLVKNEIYAVGPRRPRTQARYVLF
ncbi:hypothetical protein Y032_1055g3507 [Ancylostoma ceylanicum]|uniref:Uncharacterized protein n=1 Tax=Ancylostoma ceylanicum TaxID=53326 RepID=A0A016W6H7_9BILA|nr:hypothetical protein Y032_1055g3507 [Ancylostoma ceylanicum]